MNQDNVFTFLVIGLHKFKENPASQPLPPDLRFSLNILALYMGNSFPRTLEGLLKKCREPLKSWWPTELKLPPTFDGEATLTNYDKELSEDASDFLYDWSEATNVALSASIATKSSAEDNLAMRNLMLTLREKYLPANAAERQRLQTEYTTLRQFIIRTPYVTSSDMRQLDLHYTDRVDFSESMYRQVDSATATYWQCTNCGPLIEKAAGKLSGRKPSICNNHDQAAHHIKKIAGSRDLRVLKTGLHLRVLIPGVPELRLYDWLQEIQQQYPQHLVQVELWPGIDRYDLRLCFSDETWAVDVKDYKNPYSLAPHLVPIYSEGTLAYQKAFYVFPAYRLATPDYREIALKQASQKPADTALLSDEEFKNQVEYKIKQLRKPPKGAKNVSAS